jgi:hypothetical protein
MVRPLNNIIKPAGRYVRFQRARKRLAFDRLRQHIAPCCHPGATARQHGFDIGNNDPIGVEHKADQINVIGALTRDDAHALARSLACLGRLGV